MDHALAPSVAAALPPDRARPVLADLLSPRSIAVIGAAEDPGSAGRAMLGNLLAGPSASAVFPIERQHSSLLGVRTYPALAALPGPVDLAVIAAPAPALPSLVAECAACGVKGAVILSAGFAELGPSGAGLAQCVLDLARRGGLRLIGPDSLVVMNPISGLNATSSVAMAEPGGIAFCSQSGAMCTAILDWSCRAGFGFSGVVALGEAIDVGWGDLIDHYGMDTHTRAIVLCLEEVGDARAFLSAAREVAMAKPIIVIKGGRSGSAAPAQRPFAPDQLFDALLARAGVMRVDTIAELFGAADLLGTQPRPAGRRLAIVTNAGGPALFAADAVAIGGGELATLADATIAALDAELPAQWFPGHPIRVRGDAAPEGFADALRLALADPGSDGMLAVFSPRGVNDAMRTAELVIAQASGSRKPVFASWMGGPAVEGARALFGRAGVPTFDFPDTAARAWNTLWAYGERLRLLYETPSSAPRHGQQAPDRDLVRAIIAGALADGRTELDESEARRLVEAYHLRTSGSMAAVSDYEAVEHAGRMGYPVLIKPLQDIQAQHGGAMAALSLTAGSDHALRTAFHAIRAAVQAARGPESFAGVLVEPSIPCSGCQLSFAMAVDDQLGPVVAVGAGGSLGMACSDRAHGLPPLTSVLARRMLDQVRPARCCAEPGGGRATDPAMLDQALVRFSQLVVDHPRIRSLTIDPLVVFADGVAAVQVRAQLFAAAIADRDLPRPAVRPYPTDYCTTVTLRDGTPVALRPVRAEDEPAFVMLHQQLSQRTVRFRYFADLPLTQRIAHARLARVCHADYDREIALVAERTIPGIGGELIGVGRLTRARRGTHAEVALLVADAWQRRGLGSHLLDAVIAVARNEGVDRLTAAFLPENEVLRKLLDSRGFTLSSQNAPEMRAELALR